MYGSFAYLFYKASRWMIRIDILSCRGFLVSVRYFRRIVVVHKVFRFRFLSVSGTAVIEWKACSAKPFYNEGHVYYNVHTISAPSFRPEISSGQIRESSQTNLRRLGMCWINFSPWILMTSEHSQISFISYVPLNSHKARFSRVKVRCLAFRHLLINENSV